MFLPKALVLSFVLFIVLVFKGVATASEYDGQAEPGSSQQSTQVASEIVHKKGDESERREIQRPPRHYGVLVGEP